MFMFMRRSIPTRNVWSRKHGNIDVTKAKQACAAFEILSHSGINLINLID